MRLSHYRSISLHCVGILTVVLLCSTLMSALSERSVPLQNTKCLFSERKPHVTESVDIIIMIVTVIIVMNKCRTDGDSYFLVVDLYMGID